MRGEYIRRLWPPRSRARFGLSAQFRLARRILTAVDGSEESLRAARYAMELAELTGASVVAIHVILLPQKVSDAVQKRLKEDLASRGERALDGARQTAKDRGVGLEVKTLETNTSVVAAICETASDEKADLIVLGTRGTGGVAKLMLGSVAGGVANNARCPVLVIR